MRTLSSIEEVRSEKFEGRGVEFSSSFALRPSYLLRLLTPALSSIEEERERAPGAALNHARRRALLLPANHQEEHFQRAAQAALCYVMPEL